MYIEIKEFKTKKNSYKEIEMVNDNGVIVRCIDLGATITEIHTSDKEGKFENVVLRYENYDEYRTSTSYLGSVIGRNSGRIGGAKVTIDGVEYKLDENNGKNTLHGGEHGFNFKIFEVEAIKSEEEVIARFTYKSKDGEGGFPGNLNIVVEYALNNKNELKLTYTGESDKDTILNMTNHTYFNLSGECKRKITEQNLYINSDKITELDEESIVTGKMIDVSETPFDFRKAKKIGRDIEEDYYQLKLTKGYDHYFELNKDKEVCVELQDEVSGRSVEVTTNCNGIVIYSGNYIAEGKLSIGRDIDYRDSVCLETQNIPVGRQNLFIEDSILENGRQYTKETIYRFGLK